MFTHELFAGRSYSLSGGKNDTMELLYACSVLNGYVVVPLTASEAEEIFLHDRSEGRTIREILPHVPAPVLEIFISGTTPAEWDVNVMGIEPRPKEHYVKLGYVFEDGEAEEWSAFNKTEDGK